MNPDNDVSHTNHVVTDPFSYGYAVGDQGMLEIDAGNGSVEVVGIDDLGTVTIWGERRVRSESREDAEAHLEDIDIRIDHQRYLVRVETIHPEVEEGRIYEIDYRVRVPRDWVVAVKATKGEVDVSLLDGPLSIDLTDGDAQIDRQVGDVHATLSNGNVVGDLLLMPEGMCDISVANGDIVLGIPHTTSALFSAHVVNGTIDVSELPLDETSHSANEVHGYLGSGEGSIRLEATNGSIRVCCSR
jgi:DUF4097 and DUF4098 domain-containing protein YvlB